MSVLQIVVQGKKPAGCLFKDLPKGTLFRLGYVTDDTVYMKCNGGEGYDNLPNAVLLTGNQEAAPWITKVPKDAVCYPVKSARLHIYMDD